VDEASKRSAGLANITLQPEGVLALALLTAKDAKDAKEGILCAFFTNPILKLTRLLAR